MEIVRYTYFPHRASPWRVHWILFFLEHGLSRLTFAPDEPLAPPGSWSDAGAKRLAAPSCIMTWCLGDEGHTPSRIRTKQWSSADHTNSTLTHGGPHAQIHTLTDTRRISRISMYRFESDPAGPRSDTLLLRRYGK